MDRTTQQGSSQVRPKGFWEWVREGLLCPVFDLLLLRCSESSWMIRTVLWKVFNGFYFEEGYVLRGDPQARITQEMSFSSSIHFWELKTRWSLLLFCCSIILVPDDRRRLLQFSQLFSEFLEQIFFPSDLQVMPSIFGIEMYHISFLLVYPNIRCFCI